MLCDCHVTSPRFPRQHFSIPGGWRGRVILWVMRRYLGKRYKLTVRGRKPRVGFRYGWGGNLPLRHAKVWGVYLDESPRAKYADKLARQERARERERWERDRQRITVGGAA